MNLEVQYTLFQKKKTLEKSKGLLMNFD